MSRKVSGQYMWELFMWPTLDHVDAVVRDEVRSAILDGETTERQRANRLADECGALRTERDELLRENAQLRRTIERLERRAKR